MTSKFFVYGEDGITLKILRENLDEILKELGEKKDTDCTIFYRPSFGRTRHYGEFDAIIVTPDNAFLIESKWDESSGLSEGLKENQLRRHSILKWYQKNWKGEKGEAWNKFTQDHNPEFSKKFPNKYIPKTHTQQGKPTKLSANLQTILEAIRDRTIKDVLLVFYKEKPVDVKQEGFKVIQFQYKPLKGLFLELE